MLTAVYRIRGKQRPVGHLVAVFPRKGGNKLMARLVRVVCHLLALAHREEPECYYTINVMSLCDLKPIDHGHAKP